MFKIGDKVKLDRFFDSNHDCFRFQDKVLTICNNYMEYDEDNNCEGMAYELKDENGDVCPFYIFAWEIREVE